MVQVNNPTENHNHIEVQNLKVHHLKVKNVPHYHKVKNVPHFLQVRIQW
jgi:hypothetical protein